jgi:hypothetical protein
MKTEFTHQNTKYEPGQVFGYEESRGYGRDPKRTLYRLWTRWNYSADARAWIHDGQISAPIRATKKQIVATYIQYHATR